MNRFSKNTLYLVVGSVALQFVSFFLIFSFEFMVNVIILNSIFGFLMMCLLLWAQKRGKINIKYYSVLLIASIAIWLIPLIIGIRLSQISDCCN